MRIRVIQEPTIPSIDGIPLNRFFLGLQYEVGNTLGAYLLAEGWAEPVASDEPAVVTPLSESALERDPDTPPNLQREFFPPYYDGAPTTLALDRRHRPRRK